MMRLFRHVTRDTLRRMIYKVKIQRKRKRRTGGCDQTENESQSVQIVGSFSSSKNVIAFTIGSCHHEDVNLRRQFKYPVLYRQSDVWDDLDRMYVHELELKWLDSGTLRLLGGKSDESTCPKQKSGRKRLRESFFGLKWIRRAEHDSRTFLFHSFTPSDVHGTLHVCIPSTIFVGDLFVPKIKSLLGDALDVFDLH